MARPKHLGSARQRAWSLPSLASPRALLSTRPAAGLVAAGVVGAAGLVAAGAAAVARATDAHLVRGSLGPALVYTRRYGDEGRVRVLRSGGVFQSATFLDGRRMEPVFAYYRALERVFELVPDARRVLVVGGGGFAFPKLVAARHPGVRVEVVELDPAVIDAARRWFFLDEAVELARAGGGGLRVVCDDGRAVLDRAAPGSYDAVVLDAFVGAEPVRALATVEAARAACAALAPGGALVANVVSRSGGADVSFLRSCVASLREAFAHVAVAFAVDEGLSAEDNYLVAASNAPLDLPDAIPFDDDFPGPALHD